MMKNIFLILFVLFGFAASAQSYVTANASGGDGTLGSPWTLTEAVANATGGIVHVLAGDYGNLNLTQTNNGSSSSPIIFRSYTSSINDIQVTTGSSFNKNSSINSSFSAIIEASNTDNWIIRIEGDYVTFENFQFSGTNFGVYVTGDNSGLKNSLIREIGDLSGTAYSGFGLRLSADSSFSLNNVVMNVGAEAISIRDSGDNAIVRYNTVASDNTTNATDYYYIASGVDNVMIENNIVDRASGIPHQGHGIHLKFVTTNCTVRNNTLIGTFLEASFGANNNLFEGNTVDLHFIDFGNTLDDNFGIRIGKNANNNIFRNTFIKDAWVAIAFSSFEENTGDPNNAGIDNEFENTVIHTCRHAVGGDEFQDNGHAAARNIFRGMTVQSLTEEFIRARRPLTDFEFYNVIIDDVDGLFDNSGNGSLSASTIFSHINVSDGTLDDTSFDSYDETNITELTPVFVDESAEDFRIDNTDLNIGVATTNTTDFLGTTRPSSGITLGAYQFGSTSTTTGYFSSILNFFVE